MRLLPHGASARVPLCCRRFPCPGVRVVAHRPCRPDLGKASSPSLHQVIGAVRVRREVEDDQLDGLDTSGRSAFVWTPAPRAGSPGRRADVLSLGRGCQSRTRAVGPPGRKQAEAVLDLCCRSHRTGGRESAGKGPAQRGPCVRAAIPKTATVPWAACGADCRLS